MTESLKLNAIAFSIILIVSYVYYSAMTYISTGTFPDGLHITGLFAAIAAAFGFSFGKVWEQKKAFTTQEKRPETSNEEE